jgi:hypothetical protein
MATNRRKVDTTGDDFYPTPPWCTRALMDNEDLGTTVWEPACGNGWMAEELKKDYPAIIATDLVNRGYGVSNMDFLNFYGPAMTVDSIVTNPPYADGLAEAFVHKGISIAKKKVCMLMRLAFLEGGKRYNSLFKDTPPHRVHVFSERITFYPNGLQTAGSGTTAYGWYVWDVPRLGEDYKTELSWLPPGYKRKT